MDTPHPVVSGARGRRHVFLTSLTMLETKESRDHDSHDNNGSTKQRLSHRGNNTALKHEDGTEISAGSCVARDPAVTWHVYFILFPPSIN